MMHGAPNKARPRTKAASDGLIFRWLAVFVCGLSLTSFATAQRDGAPPKKKDESWREDPYTKSDGKALKKAGYVRANNIGWCGDYGADRIEQAMGDVKVRWLETEHFRIGCALKSWKLTKATKADKKRIREELKRLKKKIPSVKPKTKTLDPWLRAHLYAQRLEELYARLAKIVGKGPDDFPSVKGEKVKGEDMGRGPHFGSKTKFGVLLLEKESSCSRFLTTFTKAKPPGPSRWYLYEPDMFVFATASELNDGVYKDDTKMWTHVLTSVAYNLVDSYRGFYYRPPIWWQEGLMHSFRREVTTDFNSFTQCANAQEWIYERGDWEERVLGAIKHDIVRPFAEIAKLENYDTVAFADHLAMWSRVEFMRSFGDEKLGEFMHRMKGHKTAQGQAPPLKYLIEQQEKALRDIWKLDYSTFDAAWKAWAKKEYK